MKPAERAPAADDPSSPAGRTIRLAFDWLAESHARAVVFLVGFSLVCFLPGQWTIPAVDRDESRYVQATTQMLETGDYVDIRLHDKPRHVQPAGIYWLQATAVRLFGAEVPAPVGVHRLPSLVGAALVVLLTYACGLAFDGRRTALLAGIMMASTVLLNVEARLAKTDAVLNAAILGCQAVLFRRFLGAPTGLGLAVAFWLAAGAGILVKGPVLPLVVGLTAVSASLRSRDVRWLRELRPGVGVVLLVAVVAPWFVAIGLVTDGAFFERALLDNVGTKLTSGHESHGFPPGSHLALVWVTFWPAAAVAAAALPAVRSEWGSARLAWVAAWVVPAWIVFEAVPTKLPHYVLPLYPGIALAAAWALATGRIDADRLWIRSLLALSTIGPAVIVVTFLAAAVALGSGPPAWALPLAVLCLLLSVAALRLILAREILAGWLVLAVGAAPVSYAFALGGIAPRLDALWLAPRLAAATRAVARCPDPRVISVGYREASLVFAIGTDIRWGDPEAAAAFLAGGSCRAAIVERAGMPAFTVALSRHGAGAVSGPRVSGLNIGNTRFVDLHVYGSPPPREPPP